VTIPVNTTTLTGLGVISADFVFNYDPAVLDPTPANITVTAGSVMTMSAVVTINKDVAGTIVVSVFDPNGFTGAGTVVNINMRVIGPINSVTPLTLNNFRYNGTLVCSTTMSGTLTVISGTVSGRVTYENAAVPVVPVPFTNLNAPGTPAVFGSTDLSGNYSLSAFGPGSYTVTPSKAPVVFSASNGIFSNDAGLISRHVVGLITLTPTQLKAAAVSGSPSVSSFDAGLIARWIVGINDMVNQTGTWKFTPVDRTYPNVNSDQSNQDYLAILMGDVNGDWVAPTMRPAPSAATSAIPTRDAVIASVPDVQAAPRSEISVPFRIDNLAGKQVGSYQFDIKYDPAVLEPAAIAADLAGTLSDGLSVTSNAAVPGLLKVVVYGAHPASGDGVYSTLRFKVLGDIGSSTSLNILGFRFNDGLDEVTETAGSVVVTDAISGPIVRGSLLSPTGQAVIGASVRLSCTSGRDIVVLTDQFGRFEIGELVLGETCTLGVQSKRFTFSPVTASIIHSVTDLDLIAKD
jgi:hypothetical protein